MTKKTRLFLNITLIFIFFSHGLLYFVFPQDIYNEGSWIKLIKYILIFLFTIVNIFYLDGKRLFFFLGLFVFALFLMFMAHSPAEVLSPEGFKRIMLYAAPFFVYVLTPIIDEIKFKNAIVFVMIISVFAALAEYYIFRGIFARYDFSNYGGYVRVVSIFVNPNNAGLLFSLFFIYVNEQFKIINLKLFLLKISILAVLGFVIYLTGSKTPIAIILLYLLFRSFFTIWDKNKNTTQSIKTFIYTLVLFLLFTPIFLILNPSIFNTIELSGREFNLNTGEIRHNQYVEFLSFGRNQNFIAPNYYQLDKTYDLMYLQIWSDLSCIGLVVLILYFIFVYRKKIKYYDLGAKLAFILLLISGFSLTFLIIWPTGYLFWYLIFSNKFFRNKSQPFLH